MMSSRLWQRFFWISWCFATLGLVIYAAQAQPFDRSIALHTLGLGLFSAAIAVPLGAVLAWTCWGQRRINQIMLLCTSALLIVPVFLHVSMWDAAFGRLGWLTSSEGLVLQPLISGWLAACWIHGLATAPQVAVMFWIGLTLGRQTAEEQALLEMSRWRVFWFVRVRRLVPLIGLATMWTIIATSREIAATDLYRIGTLAEQIYLGYSLGQFNAIVGGWNPEELAAAAELNYGLAILMLCWIAATTGLVMIRWIGQETETELMLGKNPFRQADVLESRTSRRVKTLCSAILITLMIGLPLINLVIRGCFLVEQVAGQPTPRYSIGQLGSVLYRSLTNYRNEFWWSFLIGLTSSTLIVSVGTALIWWSRRSNTARVLVALTWIASCTIPGPLIGTLIGFLFQALNWPLLDYLYDRTIAAAVLANLVFCWPFPPLLIWFIFRNMAEETVEHARLEGASPWRVFWRFGVLDHFPKLFGCWLVTLTLCVGELSASQLVLPPGMDTLPRLMLGLLHSGVDEMTAGITIVMISVVGLISVAGWKMIHWNLTRQDFKGA